MSEKKSESSSVMSGSVALWTVAHQGPLFMEFSRQEYKNGQPFHSPGDLPNTGIEPRSPALQVFFFFSHLSHQKSPIEINLQNRKRLTNFRNKLMVASEERIVGKFGMELYPLLCSKQVTNKDLLYGTGNSAQSRMLVWMGVESGGSMDPCICMAEFLHFSPETLTTLLIGYTPIQNKKFGFLFCF